MSERTQILLADGHAMTRRMMVALLSERPEWEICAEAGNGYEAIELAKKSCPKLAILEVQMPKLNGLEAAKEIIQHCPNVLIIGDDLHSIEIFARELKRIGAKGVLDKMRLATDLVPTVEAVLNGRTCFPW